MKCQRQDGAMLPVQINHETHWRSDGTCSYCGSISPERFLAAVKDGAKLTPTDKNYKVYVDLPHPDAGKPCVLASANFDQTGPGWVQITSENRSAIPLDEWQRKNFKDGHWVQVTERGPTEHAKFYFQHLSADEQSSFIDLMNANALNLAIPGYFYVLPYFVTRAAAA